MMILVLLVWLLWAELMALVCGGLLMWYLSGPRVPIAPWWEQ